MAGILAVQLPGRKERRPVDEIDQFRDRIIGKRLAAEECRLRRPVSARPVELGRIAARGDERQPHLVGLRARVRRGQLAIFAAQLGDIVALGLRRHQRLRHADRAAGVVHVDRLAALVVGVDLHRRVHAAGGGAADQQRQFEALPLHLGRHVAHLVERGRDQPGQPDDVGLLAARGLQNLRRRHHDAEIDHLVIVAREHDADDVLADVVHVALHGRHHDLAVR